MGNMYEVDALSQGRPASNVLPGHLTQRQLEVLALMCEGLPNKQIARRLDIASGTVKIHIAHIFRALNVSSRVQAVIAVRNLGLVLKSDGVGVTRPENVMPPRIPAMLRLVVNDETLHALESSWDLSSVAVAG